MTDYTTARAETDRARSAYEATLSRGTYAEAAIAADIVADRYEAEGNADPHPFRAGAALADARRWREWAQAHRATSRRIGNATVS